ncbi:MAG: gliding motility-associated C-terminal domain-containing protein [Saprospiraceae bacterium]|nr:gliding motility-associated C-terminal domain-containing protein [Saprospiraceae bacterium]
MNMKCKLYLVLLGTFIVLNSFVNIAEENCACKIYVPNAFSPNEDGVNDTFQPYVDCTVSEYDFKVFNRWGHLVFESQKPDQGWDGEVKGKPADANVYIYVLKVSYEYEGEVENEIKTGDVALVR